MKLFGYWRSSSAWRVRIALAFKNVDYEYVAVHLRNGEQKAGKFSKRNAFAQVPVLEIEERGVRRTLTQSVAILEYLEERFADPPLLPPDPLARARVRQLTEMVNSGTQPLQNLSVMAHLTSIAPGADPKAWSRHFITRGLAALEATARDDAGRHLVGDSVTFADVVLVPQMYNARRFDVDLEPFETLLRAEAECETLPAFMRSHPKNQPDAEES